MATNFDLAPPSKTVDGLPAVPIDIESITAQFIFDGATQTASADATITYTVGPGGGNPIFDLRQTITQAWLDAVNFPIAQLAHHQFGTGTFTDLRVIESAQAAGSVHTLRVQYGLALPNSEMTGSYPPVLAWSAGPKLQFAFGMSDLREARYLEAWLPANLIFDQFGIELEIQIVGTMAAHSLITNGSVTTLGSNHWQISFPGRFTALSPMLEIRASDTLTSQTDSVVLPVSGKTVTIEATKLTSSTVNLTTEINRIKTFLTDNENDYGAYLHDNRFVAFFHNLAGMEYEGGTTSSTGALLHETFHSWFARGLKPASQADGWWDEAFTVFHDLGADDPVPFDFTNPPIVLCSRDPWQRETPDNSYDEGTDFWQGMASMLGVATLNSLIAELYQTRNSRPVSTQIIEEFLLSKSGEAQVVDAFHRFVYGLSDPSSAPDVWLKDDPAHTGTEEWDGVFWDSPDLWIRNADDGGTVHQSPEFGQDNWFHARIRNKSGAGAAQHFVVTFHSRGFAGTQFVYPADFLPCIAAKAEFDLNPGATRIVKARWPRALVPAAGTHTCLLASVITRSDHPGAGRHVWEDNNLAQKNLTVVNLLPDTFMILPIVISNWLRELDSRFELEILKPKSAADLQISFINRSQDFFRPAKAKINRFDPQLPKDLFSPRQVRLDCGLFLPTTVSPNKGRIITSDTPDLVLDRFPNSWEFRLPDKKPSLTVEIPVFTQKVVGLKVAIAKDAKAGQSYKLHFVQRHKKTRRIVGGVALQVSIR
jgi:hypothetical protein